MIQVVRGDLESPLKTTPTGLERKLDETNYCSYVRSKAIDTPAGKHVSKVNIILKVEFSFAHV